MPEISPQGVLLRVRVIGYCGSDLNTYRGLNPLVSYPRVPGHEIAATVERVGGEVPEDVRPGMDVTVLPYTACGRCSSCRWGRPNACKNNQTLGVQREGALGEYLVVPWQKIVQAPGLSLAELALVEPLAVGFHAVERGRVAATDTVVILGSGMIGLGAIAGAALARGARVIAVDIDDQKLDLARAAGAKETVNSAKENLPQRVMELTNGDGAGVVIEAVGSVETFIAAIDLVAYSGRVVYIGYASKPVSYNTKYFLLKELDILGSRGATHFNFEQTIALLQSKRYPVERTVTRTVPMEEAPDAMQQWAQAPSRITKIHVAIS
jgi:threonine dehydrogenase-like Zn-dependent dehydrogenase